MVIGHHHVSFTISSLAVGEDFFARFFDFRRIAGGRYQAPYVKTLVGYRDAVLDVAFLSLHGVSQSSAGLIVELIEYVEPKCSPADTATCRPGSAHLCLVVDDIQADYERMKEAGVEFLSPPNEVTYGVNKGSLVIYLKGPDNIRLELIQLASS